jgi:HK97 family phage major capsid protein
VTATEIRLPSSDEQFERCAELGDKLRELSNTPASKREDGWVADLRSTTAELSAADAVYDMALKRERAEMERMAWDHAIANPPKPESRGPGAAFAPTGAEEVRSPGEMFVEDARAKEMGYRTGNQEIEVRNLLTSGTSSPAAGQFIPLGQPQLYVPPRRRRLFVRDLLNVQQTNLGSVPYIRELNAATNETGATAVAEASAKPEITMEFERDDAPIRKLAAWVQVTEEVLNDAPTLRGYIDGRLGYMLMVAEERSVIGDNSGFAAASATPNIKGILAFSGLASLTGEFYDAVADGIGDIEAVDGDPDGVVVHPSTYWAAVSDRHATFYDGGPFGAGGGAPFSTPELTAWGLPVVRSRSLAAGKALVGSFAMGATLFENTGVTIRTTDSHASLFISNTWVILAEERVGLAVHRPDWFSYGSVTAPS